MEELVSLAARRSGAKHSHEKNISMSAWFGSLFLVPKNLLVSLVKVASKIIGSWQVQPSDLYKKMVSRRANAILSSQDHPLREQFEILPSGRRFRVPKCETNRMRSTFIPSAIMHLNGT